MGMIEVKLANNETYLVDVMTYRACAAALTAIGAPTIERSLLGLDYEQQFAIGCGMTLRLLVTGGWTAVTIEAGSVVVSGMNNYYTFLNNRIEKDGNLPIAFRPFGGCAWSEIADGGKPLAAFALALLCEGWYSPDDAAAIFPDGDDGVFARSSATARVIRAVGRGLRFSSEPELRGAFIRAIGAEWLFD